MHNFEHISNYILLLPFRKARWLFAFYKSMEIRGWWVLSKITEEEKKYYQVSI